MTDPTRPYPTHDPLTGLANHRVFHERLQDEFARAGRHGRPLSIAVIDINDCRVINNNHGHIGGDEVLREVGRRLEGVARQGELIARVGGDQFGWILPDADGLEAYAAAERARRSINTDPISPAGPVTVAIGVCDLDNSGSVSELYARAERALYWAKYLGRDQSFRYSVATADQLLRIAPPREDAGTTPARFRSLSDLAHDADAKHADFADHCNRVASLATTLAVAAGWSAGEVVALHRAALLHDIGKISIPEGIIGKAAALDAEEQATLRSHPVLGAEMLAAGHSREQVSWVRHHHERWDGGGYPDGLAGPAIPEGAQLIALADTYDALTHDRPYRSRMSHGDALDEMRACAGAQFSRRMVELLERAVSAPGAPRG